MRHEALEVAGERTGKREEANDHDDRRQRKDGRLFGGAGDEIAGGCHQRHAEADRKSAESDCEDDSSARHVRQRQQAPEERHAACSDGARMRPPSRRTIRSASAASSGR